MAGRCKAGMLARMQPEGVQQAALPGRGRRWPCTLFPSLSPLASAPAGLVFDFDFDFREHSAAKVREISIGFGCLKFTGTGFERFCTTPPNRRGSPCDNGERSCREERESELHAKVASCARLCECLLLSMYQALSVCVQRRDAYWLCGAILRSLPHEKRSKQGTAQTERANTGPACTQLGRG